MTLLGQLFWSRQGDGGTSIDHGEDNVAWNATSIHLECLIWFNVAESATLNVK